MRTKWCIYTQHEALDGYDFEEFNDDQFPFETHQEAIGWAIRKFYYEGHYGPYLIEPDNEDDPTEFNVYSMRRSNDEIFYGSVVYYVPDHQASLLKIVREEIKE